MTSVARVRRDMISRESKIDSLDFRKDSLEEILPAHFVSEYPQFVKFLQTYYDFLESSQGLDNLIYRLRDIRNADLARDENLENLKQEYGSSFPENSALSDATALRIFESFLKSKGNKDAIEAYFRLFLNAEAEVIYPKDNMLIVSGGDWNNSEQRWNNAKGHLSETTMVIQDSSYYQLFSYLIRTELSIADWGPIFRNLAHPAGWNLFGEVRLTELAKFEQFEEFTSSGARSPTEVPGFQIRDSNILIIGAALALAIGGFQVSEHPLTMNGISQFITKFFKIVLAQSTNLHSFQDANKLFLASTYKMGELQSFAINRFVDTENKNDQLQNRNPVRIVYKGPNREEGLGTPTVFSKGSHVNIIPSNQSFIVAFDILFPETPVNGFFFEDGGSDSGAWFGIRDGGSTLRWRCGSATGGIPHTASPYLDIEDFPKDDNIHNVVLSVEWDGSTTLTSKVFIDGIEKIPVASNNFRGSSLIRGTNIGTYLKIEDASDVPTGESFTQLPYIGTASDLRLYSGEFIA